MPPVLSILDLAFVQHGQPVPEALAGCVDVARQAEASGYHRIWYAEHHNMPSIASSATAVLIAHVAAHTQRIRLGSGGVMLPNHAPLVIAEQFGTLASLHPGRIDLGVGRAPGTDQITVRALRRDPRAADRFPHDVLELQAYLGDQSRVEGVAAIPGRGTHVPLYILGSSLFGAQLAGQLGLPFAFASHFAPRALHEAVATYRRSFHPSTQLEMPYTMAGVNVIAADTEDEAADHLLHARRSRVRRMFTRAGRPLSDEEADEVLSSPQAAHVDEMMTHTAVGTPQRVAAFLGRFATDIQADELITVHAAPTPQARLRSIELTAMAAAPAR